MMMASKKRDHDQIECEDLSTMSSPCKSAKLQGVITQLSPMKGKFFDGRLTDERASIRIVGFDAMQEAAGAS